MKGNWRSLEVMRITGGHWRSLKSLEVYWVIKDHWRSWEVMWVTKDQQGYWRSFGQTTTLFQVLVGMLLNRSSFIIVRSKLLWWHTLKRWAEFN